MISLNCNWLESGQILKGIIVYAWSASVFLRNHFLAITGDGILGQGDLQPDLVYLFLCPHECFIFYFLTLFTL